MNCTKQDIEREFILQNQSLSSNPAKLEEMSVNAKMDLSHFG